LNFPVAMNPGLAKAIGVMMKLDFERAVLNRIPQIEAHPDRSDEATPRSLSEGRSQEEHPEKARRIARSSSGRTAKGRGFSTY